MIWALIIGTCWILSIILIAFWNYGAHKNDPKPVDYFLAGVLTPPAQEDAATSPRGGEPPSLGGDDA